MEAECGLGLKPVGRPGQSMRRGADKTSFRRGLGNARKGSVGRAPEAWAAVWEKEEGQEVGALQECGGSSGVKKGPGKLTLESMPWIWQVETSLGSMTEWFQKGSTRQSQTIGVEGSGGKDGRFSTKRKPEKVVI